MTASPRTVANAPHVPHLIESLKSNRPITPLTADGTISFLYGVDSGAGKATWTTYQVTPSAALYNSAVGLLPIWVLDIPATLDEVADVARKFGMPALDEPIPASGDGWTVVHGAETVCTLDELRSAYVAPVEADDEPEVVMHNDAIVRTPYNENDYLQEIIVTIGGSRESRHWKPVKDTIAGFIAKLCQHKVDNRKDGAAFVCGDLVPGQRLKTSVKALYGVGLDIDTGTPSEVVDVAVEKLGVCAVRYTTHSHGKTRTEFKKDKIVKFAPDHEIDDDLIQRFLREVERWDESIVATATYEGTDHTEKGIVVFVSHAPMSKHRVFIPFASPFVIADEGQTQVKAMEKWTKVPTAVAAKLGVPIDKTGTDPSRLFYTARHAEGKPFEISLFGGPLFDWRSLILDNPFEEIAAEVTKGTGKSVTQEGRELGRWSMKRAHGFQIADVVEQYAPDRIRGNASQGFDIECPFDEDHSNAGDQGDRACFIVNAGSGQSEFFTISCRHEGCRNKTNLDMLGKMIKDGWFDKAVLEDEQWNAVVLEEDAPQVAKKLEKQEEDASFDFYDEEELVREIDSICRVVALGGKRRFVVLGRDQEPQFLTKEDAAVHLARYKLWENKGTAEDPDWKSQPAFNVWLRSSERKPDFSAARFDPNLKTGDVGNGLLNLWTGFAVTPKEGNWSLLRTHIWENICRENEEHFLNLMGWMAQLFQQPGRKSGVAVVLRGDIGVGKTKLPEWIGNIIGDHHATTSDKSEQCTGKFNALLERNIFISAEEAFFAGDPTQKGPLNHLITGHKLMYEPKGRDAYMGRNYSRLMMTTNAKFAVPAVARERRYLVLDVSSAQQKNKAYFKAIDDQMESGGAEAMLHELLTHDYSAIDFQNPPMTDALKDIIQRGLDSNERWLVDVLTEGRFPFRVGSSLRDMEWNDEILKSVIVASYNDFVPSYKKVPADAQDVQRFLRERIGPLTSSKMTVHYGKTSTREPSWKLPPLADAREAYSKAKGYVFETDEDAG